MGQMERLHTGELYLPGDPAIAQLQAKLMDRLKEYNELPRTQPEAREAKLKELFAQVGEGCYIESPFYANFGGAHVHLGKMVYANFGLTLVDDTHIYIGDYTMIGPNVTIATAGHPIDPELRQKGLQYNMPVTIGKNCWLGAGVVVLPGVTIGDNTVVGAGSIVTKDLPSGVVAVGNPCRVLREIDQRDRAFYFRNRAIPEDFR